MTRHLSRMATLAFAITILGMAWQPVRAAEPGGLFPFKNHAWQAWRDCADDRARLCSDVALGGGRIVRCLLDNRDVLAPKCARHARKVDAVKTAADACNTDVARYCAAVPPGGGRIMSCLGGNRDRLSEPCRAQLRDAAEVFRD